MTENTLKNPILLHSAKSIIERDAILYNLSAEGLNAHSPKRDMSRKFTENTFDYSLGAYSLFFDGFKIFIEEENYEEAQSVLEDYQSYINQNEDTNKTVVNPYFRKFYFFSLFTLVFPLVPLFFTNYYLAKGIMKKEKLSPMYFTFSFLLNVFHVWFLIYMMNQNNFSFSSYF